MAHDQTTADEPKGLDGFELPGRVQTARV